MVSVGHMKKTNACSAPAKFWHTDFHRKNHSYQKLPLYIWKQKINTASQEVYIWAIQNSSPEPRTKHTNWGSSCQINRTNVMYKNGVFLSMYPTKAKREYSGSALKSIGRDGSCLFLFPRIFKKRTRTPYTFFGGFFVFFNRLFYSSKSAK